MTFDATQLGIMFDRLATTRGTPSRAVVDLLAEHKAARKATCDGRADRARELLRRDEFDLAALDTEEKAACARLGEISASAKLGGDGKGLPGARKDVDDIRARRQELTARIDATRRRIAEYDAADAARMMALYREQAAELNASLKQTIADNADRWAELIDEVNRRVSDETALRHAALAAQAAR